MLRLIRSNALILLVALSALWVGRCWGHRSAPTGTLRGDTVTVVQHIRQTDTLYVQQKDTLVVYRTRWRTLIDSIVAHDTIPLTPRETTIVAHADSTINACSLVVLTCEQRVAQRDSLADDLRVQLKHEKSQRRHRVSFGTAVTVGALGVLTGMLVK